MNQLSPWVGFSVTLKWPKVLMWGCRVRQSSLGRNELWILKWISIFFRVGQKWISRANTICTLSGFISESTLYQFVGPTRSDSPFACFQAPETYWTWNYFHSPAPRPYWTSTRSRVVRALCKLVSFRVDFSWFPSWSRRASWLVMNWGSLRQFLNLYFELILFSDRVRLVGFLYSERQFA